MRPKFFIAVVIIGMVAAAASFITYRFQETARENNDNTTTTSVASVRVGKTYGQATVGGPFTLIDQDGKRRTDADYKGKYMVVYFGYSFCPDICPAALYNMTQAFQKMSQKELKTLAPLFITIDPQRDTTSNLKTYIQNFHPSFTALTGSQDQIDKAAKAYRVYAKKAKPDGTSTEYLLDHSSIVYVMDRQGRFITSFNHQTEPEIIKQTLRKIIE
ncbi:MAG: SCO family protein [Alphaproteobacteria bacterium]|nr:SCO family protein [Alphaproteobacteria bacterium]